MCSISNGILSSGASSLLVLCLLEIAALIFAVEQVAHNVGGSSLVMNSFCEAETKCTWVCIETISRGRLR